MAESLMFRAQCASSCSRNKAMTCECYEAPESPAAEIGQYVQGQPAEVTECSQALAAPIVTEALSRRRTPLQSMHSKEREPGFSGARTSII